MPDAEGNIKGISVPELPWKQERYVVVGGPYAVGQEHVKSQRFKDKGTAERFAVWLAAYKAVDAYLLDGFDLPAAGAAPLKALGRVDRSGRWRDWAIPPVFTTANLDA